MLSMHVLPIHILEQFFQRQNGKIQSPSMIKMIIHLNPEEILNFQLVFYCSIYIDSFENNPDIIWIFIYLWAICFPLYCTLYSSLFTLNFQTFTRAVEKKMNNFRFTHLISCPFRNFSLITLSSSLHLIETYKCLLSFLFSSCFHIF